MSRSIPIWRYLFVALIAVSILGTGTIPVLAEGTGSGEVEDSSSDAPDATALRTRPLTTIVVDSGTDPNDSLSQTCETHTPCTLRRAIVQARNVPASERPVLISFNIPAQAAHGYNAAHNLWEIQVFNTTRTLIFRQLTGQIIIDGSTQPGRRPEGPKIMIVGPGGGMKDGLVLGETALQHENVVSGIGFQNLRTQIIVNSDNNLIEYNWFGLNHAGTAPLLRNNEPQQGSGNAGISLQAAADYNEIRHNAFLGLNGVAVAVRGTNNLFENNTIGTRSNGLVTDKQTDPSLICTPVDWLGGGGISVADRDNTIRNNTFAGLRLAVSQWSIQTDAIRVTGRDHTIEGNRIGYDVNENEIGVCGRGIYLSDGPRDLRIQHNRIVEPGLSAISLNGIMYNGNTLRGNTVKKSSGWPQMDGSPRQEDAIQLGPILPAAFLNFKPAMVVNINGTTVSGTSGAGSPCPNCIVELFLDDSDAVSEALQSLAVVTANAAGNWSTTIPFELPSGHGIRTTSTTAAYNTISLMNAGTTTGLSVLYRSGHEVFLPMIVRGR